MAVVGAGAASRLDVTAGDDVVVGARVLRVIGVVTPPPELAALATGVAVVAPQALGPGELLFEAAVVDASSERRADAALAIPYVLAPGSPRRVAVEAEAPLRAPPALAEDLERVLVPLAVATVVAAVVMAGIVSHIGLLGRRQEMGLRQALGASPRGIALQLTFECALLGLLGGLFGAGAGLWSSVGLSALGDYPCVVVTAALWAGPLLGALATCLGSLPVIHSVLHLDPATALRL